MNVQRFRVVSSSLACVCATALAMHALSEVSTEWTPSRTLSAQAPQRLPIEPFRQFGSSVTPAFEGWHDNPDGSRVFLIGYLNRNSEQPLDVPIGPNNRIEPGGPDLGQPTHFLPGRQWGMFTITVPKEFTKRTAADVDHRGQRSDHEHPLPAESRLPGEPIS